MPRTAKAPAKTKEICKALHPDGDTTCSRNKGHKGQHSGPFGEGMSLTWRDGAAAAPIEDDCTATLNGVKCERGAGHATLHGAIDKNGNLTEWIDHASDQTTLKTEVDGKIADVVLDGTTGAPVDDQPKMLDSDIRDVEKQLSKAYGILTQREAEKKRANEAHKEAQLAVNGLVGELVRRVNGEQPLPFTPAAVDDDEDDEEPPRMSESGIDRIAREVRAAAGEDDEPVPTRGMRVRDTSGEE